GKGGAGRAEERPPPATERLIVVPGRERRTPEQEVPGSGDVTTAARRSVADTAVLEQIAEDEDRFRSIFATSHAVMLIVDPQTGAIVDANPAASAYYGHPLETLTTMQIADLNVLDREDLFRDMQKAVTGEKRQFSFLHRLADGRYRDVDVFSGRVIICGRVLLHSIIHDVTGRRRAEEQFRALLDATPDAAMLINHSGIILALNEVMATRFKKTVEELLGACAYDILTPELAMRRRELTIQALATGKPLRHVDEREGRILENVLFPVPGDQEDSRRVAVISHDITRERELEQARQEAFDRIRQNIEQFAILGDHIRQPLQVILGMACLLEDEQATGKIQREIERINGYIRQLDQGWIDSRKIREYLQRHEQL
ncbi:MAG TPA: PAS domain S-box protein, partial [Methanoculleus sp.]|nr:PAS domain S-box protein [Methanoculleus sp.]